MSKRIWMTMLCVGLVALSAAFVACGDDDDDGGSEEDKQAAADFAVQMVSYDGSEVTEEDIDFYMSHITDEFVQEFGTESVEACRENSEECIGSPLTNPSVTAAEVEIDGDEARVPIASDDGVFGITLLKDGDDWKADGLYVPDDEIAEGTEVVDLDLVEFAFEGDLESDAVKSGDFAFHVTNSGEQAHEAVLVELPAEGTLEELLADESFQPEPIFVKFGYGPGDESDVALPAPLEPGRYGLVCFLPDTDEGVSPEEATPHAFKGMVAEFTVE